MPLCHPYLSALSRTQLSKPLVLQLLYQLCTEIMTSPLISISSHFLKIMKPRHFSQSSQVKKPTEPVFVSIYGAQESIPPAYAAWRASTKNSAVVPAREARNRFLGPLKGLQIRALFASLDFSDACAKNCDVRWDFFKDSNRSRFHWLFWTKNTIQGNNF